VFFHNHDNYTIPIFPEPARGGRLVLVLRKYVLDILSQDAGGAYYCLPLLEGMNLT
jgi:hypothetical protein